MAFRFWVMGWTGAKARQFKIAYIEEFNRMEATLRTAAATPTINLNDPAALRHLLIGYSERVIRLENENAELAPKAAALARISTRDGESSLRQASKELFGRAHAIFPVLEEIKWLYRSGTTWCPYQTKVPRYLVVREIECSDGTSRPQTLITPNGRTALAEGLARLVANAAALEAFNIVNPEVARILREFSSFASH